MHFRYRIHLYRRRVHSYLARVNPTGTEFIRPISTVHSSPGYCRFHLVCPGQKIGDRNFFWAWYKLKSICVLYFHFVPSPEKVSLAKFFPERGGGQTKWNRQYSIRGVLLVPFFFKTGHACTNWKRSRRRWAEWKREGGGIARDSGAARSLR